MDAVMLEQLRAVDLGLVLRDLGATRDQYDRHKFRLGGVLVNVNGQRFYLLREGRGGGGAIDLVMQVTRRDFRGAVEYLSRYVGGETVAGVRQQAGGEQQQRPVFRLPEPCVRCGVGVQGYLCGERALPEALVDRVHQAGDVYADRRGNAVFVRRDEAGNAVGASLRGTRPGSRFRGLVAGSKRDAGYFSVAVSGAAPVEPAVLVLVESPIDALSYGLVHALRGDPVSGQVVSTDGAGALPVGLISGAVDHGEIVVCAFDADAAGDAFWEQVRGRYPVQTQGERSAIRRERPQAKDWNDALRAAIQQGREPGQHPRG